MDVSASLSKLHSFHEVLNKETVLPKMALRRNASVYNLVCYINVIIGLLLSGNVEPIPIFVARACEHMKENSVKYDWDPYYTLVNSYLTHVVFHLQTYYGIAFDAECIPLASVGYKAN